MSGRGRWLTVLGLMLASVAGCQTLQHAADNDPANVAPVPPVRRADGGGLLLNPGDIQLGPGAGGRSGYRWVGDGEMGF
jgi:hypothetical protein